MHRAASHLGLPCWPLAQVYSLDKLADYRHAQETVRLGVPYYIKDPVGFEKSYAKGGRSR